MESQVLLVVAFDEQILSKLSFIIFKEYLRFGFELALDKLKRFCSLFIQFYY